MHPKFERSQGLKIRIGRLSQKLVLFFTRIAGNYRHTEEQYRKANDMVQFRSDQFSFIVMGANNCIRALLTAFIYSIWNIIPIKFYEKI